MAASGEGSTVAGGPGAEAVFNANLLYYFTPCEYFMVQNTNEENHRKNIPSSRASD